LAPPFQTWKWVLLNLFKGGNGYGFVQPFQRWKWVGFFSTFSKVEMGRVLLNLFKGGNG